MTLLQLRYFQLLSRTLHYTHTAEQLHVSQPSLSYAINELEKELGVKLFQKEKQKVCSFSPMWTNVSAYCRKAATLSKTWWITLLE